MSRKQTRKSISVSGDLYDAIRAEAQRSETTGSGMVEAVMRKHLGLEQRTMGRPRPPEPADTPKTTIRTVVDTGKTGPRIKPKIEIELDQPTPAQRKDMIRKVHQAKAVVPTEANGGGIFTF